MSILMFYDFLFHFSEKYKGKNITLPKVQLEYDLWGKRSKSGKGSLINEENEALVVTFTLLFCFPLK